MERMGLLIGIGIVTVGILVVVLNLPWAKPLVREDAKIIIKYDDGSCEVQTTSRFILVIWDCKDKQVGEQVKVEYRKDTSIGNIIT